MDCECKECPYRIAVARIFDVHIWEEDCDKYGTEYCTKTNAAERRMIVSGRKFDYVDSKLKDGI